MSNSLALQLDRVKSVATDLIRRVEESPLFERIVIRFENLDVRQQKSLRILGILAFVGIPLLIVVLPFATVIMGRGLLSDSRSLVSEMQRFNEEQAVVRQPAPRPLGWQALAAGSPEELESSLNQYLGGVGVTGDLLELTRTGETIKLSIKELSIKQAVAFVHQLDGWYPAIHVLNLKVRVNATDKQLLSLDAELKHDSAGAQQLGRQPAPRDGAQYNSSSSTSDTGSFGGSGSSDFGGSELDSSPPPPSPPSSSNSYDAPMDDFGDLPPPPPFEEDL